MKAGAKLTTTQTDIYTANQKEAVSIFVVNTDASNSVNVTLLISGDGGATYHEFFKAPLNPNSSVQLTGIALDQNDIIAGVGDVAGVVSVVITGMEA